MSASIITAIFNNRAEERLSLEDERAAIAAAQRGDEAAKERLMLAYAAALRDGAKTAGAIAASEDARQAAILGLLEAIAAFDLDKHDGRLAGLAAQYIKDSVVQCAQSESNSFTIPPRTLKRFFGILRAAEGNVFEAVALAPRYEMRKETFLAVLSAVRNVDSIEGLQTALGSGQDLRAIPVSGDLPADAEDTLLVELAFEAVDDFEADICRLAYGFAEYDPLPDAEIAERMGLSRPKTQRVRSGALAKMRTALAA